MWHLLAVLWILGSFLYFGSGKHWRRLHQMPEGRRRNMEALRLVQGKFREILKAADIEVLVEGEENIPEDEAVLFIGNHRSFFDVVIGYILVKGPTGFISKAEIGRIAPLRQWMLEVKCLFMERGDLRQNLKTVLAAIRQVREGISIWIYPEGSRSRGKDERDMLPFKAGSFKIAEKTGCKIIPVAMIHTREVFEAHFPWIHATRVRVRVGEPILLSELGEEKVEELVRKRIISMLTELKQEDGRKEETLSGPAQEKVEA